MLGKFYAYEDWLVNLNEMYYEKLEKNYLKQRIILSWMI